ncbi:hypothetical protein RISK_006579 [Rhodopirellula islandica]|uniref:Uncharacterized protein n=1 Tax=Rhodopirellula islandica TaxID=595434 RepID=A0A0J1B4A1_RHOIS|nr:hypothetical protein RISK_006579 [Rhodopirellula islandica]
MRENRGERQRLTYPMTPAYLLSVRNPKEKRPSTGMLERF